jgi:phosphoenolpyruvate carboxykinase (ATP)
LYIIFLTCVLLHRIAVPAGWTGGKYGVGKRMSIAHTRAIIDAIHSGELETADYTETPIFHLKVCDVVGLACH